MADKNMETLQAYLDEGCRVVAQLTPKALRYVRYYSIADEDGTIQNFEVTFEANNKTKELQIVSCHIYNDAPVGTKSSNREDTETVEWDQGGEHITLKLIDYGNYSSVKFTSARPNGDLSSVTTATNYRNKEQAKADFNQIKKQASVGRELF